MSAFDVTGPQFGAQTMGMRPEDLHKFLRRTPFRPFRITLTDGRMFEIHHPELLMVGRTSAEIGIPSRRHVDPTYDRLVSVSLLHVMQMELLPESDAG